MRTKGPDLERMFAQMHAELVAWRAAHPEASFDEIAAQVTPRRQRLMGALLSELALQHGNGYALKGLPAHSAGKRWCTRAGRSVRYHIPRGKGRWPGPTTTVPTVSGVFHPGSTAGAGAL